MAYLIKGGIALLSLGAVSGASYAGYSHFSKDNSIANKLGISVLSLTGDTNSKQWEARLNELKLKISDLDSSLASLKTSTWEKVRDWCNSKKENTFNKDDIIYKNFEEFCTWKVGDKLSKKIEPTVIATHNDWGTAHAALKKIDKSKLSKELQKVHVALSESDADKKAMHGWCTANYKKTWTGDNEAIFEETKEYCKTS